jgi:hypothetical protein
MISIGCAIYRIKKEVENTNSGFAVEVAYLILQEPLGRGNFKSRRNTDVILEDLGPVRFAFPISSTPSISPS